MVASYQPHLGGNSGQSNAGAHTQLSKDIYFVPTYCLVAQFQLGGYLHISETFGQQLKDDDLFVGQVALGFCNRILGIAVRWQHLFGEVQLAIVQGV